ncbi:hypothetical protein SH1V18_18060 [Vallitalea longa]|uniref:Beta-galactosidase trimerisation domain-containing protein n=1 Tax=Vallitalea longa TaxID=2936439 RepID=A0A9W6DDS7_9FIRM|nr:alpha-amylase family protein [Vallitalea longa]GKX29326.1 hypothetical protein SH1V18_18060 [Vallitalea longa]
MGKMPFRQIHLDFHTGGEIPGVGSKFNKQQFQNALIKGHVNSINIFAKGHHGFLYYLDGVSKSHPTLEIDLLENMLEACKEIDVKTQIYISAGLDEMIARKHPEWLFRNQDQSTVWVKDFTTAGYHELCMNTPYLDYLLKQVEEVTNRFETEGIFLDIVGPRKCHCQTCMNQLIEEGKDPRDEKAVIELGERVYKNYLERIVETIHSIKPDMKIFHNSGHIKRGRRDLFGYYTHFELESLPTGGWGYDHFPLSARYVQGLGKEFLGMTGKFHTTWGEFGGFKHPNALRYESALNLANGAKICVGDQMHPQGMLDEVTYALIGEAYKEVEEKEPWCDDVENIADIGLLSEECIDSGDLEVTNDFVGKADAGAVRMLLEGKYLFNVIDLEEDFNKYKVIILPDVITVDEILEEKLNDYINRGGKILATGNSCLDKQRQNFAIDMGIKYEGNNPYKPDYFVPHFSYQGLGSTSFIMYSDGIKISLDGGEVLGEREDSYFNRDLLHFSSHFHTPNEPGKRSPGMVKSDAGIYIAWQVFTDYATKGSLILKDSVKYALDKLLSDNKSLSTNLMEQGVTTLQHQKDKNRYINHLLYAIPVNRGEGVEVIEDIVPIYDVDVTLQVKEKIEKVYLAPQMIDIPYSQTDGKLTYNVDKVDCHQMVVIQYK